MNERQRQTDRQNPGTDKELLHRAGMDAVADKSWKVYPELIHLPVNPKEVWEGEAGIGLGESIS